MRLIGSVLWLKEYILCELIVRHLSVIVQMRIGVGVDLRFMFFISDLDRYLDEIDFIGL